MDNFISKLLASVILLVTGAFVLAAYVALMSTEVAANIVGFLVVLLAIGVGLLLHWRAQQYRYPYWIGLGFSLFILSAVNFEFVLYSNKSWAYGLPYFIGGLVATGIALWINRSYAAPVEAKWGAEIKLSRLRIQWLAFIPGLVCFALLTEINGMVFDINQLRVSLHAQFALLCGGLILLVIGASGMRWRNLANFQPAFKVDAISLGLMVVILLGLLLRTWQLETAIHQFVDEMNFARGAWTIKQPYTDYIAMMSPFSTVAAFPWIYPYWQSISIDIFGWNLTALRMISVLFGTLTIPALFFLMSQLFDRWLALIVALLLAVFPPHIHFSRIGLNNIADPFFGVLMLAFMTRALKSQRQVDYALAGVMLGMTQYFYEGGRVVYPLLAVAWVNMMVVLNRVRMNRQIMLRFGLFVLIGVIVAIPMYYTLIAYDLPLLARFKAAGLGGSYWQVLENVGRQQTFSDHILRPLMAYVRTPDLSEFYGGHAALLLVFVVPFAMMGLAYSLWQPRRQNVLLLLMWFGVVTVGGMFLAEGGQTQRFIVVFPALIALIVIGLHLVTLKNAPVMLLIASVLAVAQVNYYFNEHLDIYNDQRRQSLDFQDAVFRATDLRAGSEACIVTEGTLDRILIQDMVDYLASDVQICYLAPRALTQTFLDSREIIGDMAFFVEPENEAAVDVLQRYYGAALEGPLSSPYDTVPLHRQYMMYVVRS